MNEDSRYINDAIDVVTDSRGTHQVVNVPTIPETRAYDFTYYLTDDSDTVDYLAHALLGDGALWWILADVNPEIIDWTNLPAGTILRIPASE